MRCTYVGEELHMREFVVGCQSLEHNRLLVLLVQVRVLRFEEDQLVICANDEVMEVS